MKKVKGFTMIEALLALTIAAGAAATMTTIKLDEIKLENSKGYAKDINDLVNAVDQRISIDGYDIDLWNKQSWSSAEMTKLVNNDLQGTGSKCGNGTWTPKNGENDIRLVNCSLLERKPYNMDVEAELTQDSFGFIKQFKLRYSFQNIDDFKDDFMNFKNTFRNATVNNSGNVTGTTSYNFVSALTDFEISPRECVILRTDCIFEITLDRQGGSEYIRANGENSMINATLSFIDTKGNAPLKCLRWSKDESDNWTKEVDEECGIGIYENGTRMVVDIAGDTGTYENILLNKECIKYKYDGSNIVADGVSPCGIINNGTEVYQVVENINTAIITSQNGQFENLVVNEIVAKTVSAEYIEATKQIKSHLIKTDTIQSATGNRVVIDSHLTVTGRSIYAPDVYLIAREGSFSKSLNVGNRLSVKGDISANDVFARDATLRGNLNVEGTEINAKEADVFAKNVTLTGNLETRGLKISNDIFIGLEHKENWACWPNTQSIAKDAIDGRILYCDNKLKTWQYTTRPRYVWLHTRTLKVGSGTYGTGVVKATLDGLCSASQAGQEEIYHKWTKKSTFHSRRYYFEYARCTQDLSY